MSDVNILVAGIGNIFLGDDGFGSEVVRRHLTAALSTNDIELEPAPEPSIEST